MEEEGILERRTLWTTQVVAVVDWKTGEVLYSLEIPFKEVKIENEKQKQFYK
jgi:hypothetical protein